MKVSISHPSRQHSHQTAFALQQGGMLQRYYVPLWYKPDRFPYSFLARGRLKTEFLKRYFEPLDQSLIAQIPQYELVRRISHLLRKADCMKHIYWMNERFDSSVASRLCPADYDVFIGGETATLESFRATKEQGKKAVLDLAQTHYSSHGVLHSAGLDPFQGNRKLQEQVERRKDQEISLADFIFTPSTVAYSTLTNAGIPAEKLILIAYGYDHEIFCCKNEYGRSGTFRILFVGAITKRKGIETILQAFSNLKLENAELVFAGGKADATPLIPANGRVRFAGFANQSELKRLYQEADVFVLPSLLDSFGLVVLEAMGCGTPVIVSETTGAKDVVRDGIDGFVIPPRDAELLSERILYLYKNRDAGEQMGREANMQAQNFTWNVYRQRVRNALDKLIHPQTTMLS